MLISLSPAAAHAEPPSSANREQARKLAAQGFEALRRKDYSSAEDLLRRADELVHAPTLKVDHARALVGLGKLVEGHEGYAQVLREGVAANAPWQWRAALVDARTELAAVEVRLAWLTIIVNGADSPVVQLDGKAVPDAAQGVKRATNPGLRVVSARAEGFLPLQKAITLKEGQSAELELTLERDPNAAPPPIASPPLAPEVVVVAAPPLAQSPDRTLPIVLVSAGGAALVVGAVTGIMALSVRSDLRKTCTSGVCVPSSESEYTDYRQKRDRYRGLGTASGVSLAMGAGAALTGVALFLFSGKSSSSVAVADETHATHPSLQVGLGSLLISGAF
ncbi:MAG: hypothetical protein ABIQ16_11720 [Polyangiaceae bacterium]